MKIKLKIKPEVYLSVCFGAVWNEKQGGFFDTQENGKKRAPDWSTSCSIEGLSFFLFTPSLQRNPGGGKEKEKIFK